MRPKSLPTVSLMLAGTPCPMNYVTAKSTLDRMAPGEVLELTVDGPPVGEDVAASLAAGGYELLEVSHGPRLTVLQVRRRTAAGSGSAGRRRDCGCGGRRRRR